MRRFTRLTNGFSKKVENLAHAVSLHFMFYNFGRIHKSLRVTPAMESLAGFTARLWMDFIVYIYLRNAVGGKCACCFRSVPGSFAAVRLW